MSKISKDDWDRLVMPREPIIFGQYSLPDTIIARPIAIPLPELNDEDIPLWEDDPICAHCGGIEAHSEGCPQACNCDDCVLDYCECECHDGEPVSEYEANARVGDEIERRAQQMAADDE